jgi:hypothetical protein
MSDSEIKADVAQAEFDAFTECAIRLNELTKEYEKTGYKYVPYGCVSLEAHSLLYAEKERILQVAAVMMHGLQEVNQELAQMKEYRNKIEYFLKRETASKNSSGVQVPLKALKRALYRSQEAVKRNLRAAEDPPADSVRLHKRAGSTERFESDLEEFTGNFLVESSDSGGSSVDSV